MWWYVISFGAGVFVGLVAMSLLNMARMDPFDFGELDTYDEAFSDGPITTLPTDQPGWVRWNGGACPVVRFAQVDVMMRDGSVLRNTIAYSLDWQHRQNEHDILGYREAA